MADVKFGNSKEVNDILTWLSSATDLAVQRGLMVTSKTRKDILLHYQNCIGRHGHIVDISWQNMGCGVYRVYLKTDA